MGLKIAPPVLKDRARALRSASIEAEAILWSRLRNGQVKRIRFRRQRPIGPYIVDFDCPEFGLVIEIDGPGHSLPDRSESDALRSAYLEAHGVKVLRFMNAAVAGETGSVVETIAQAMSPSPRPSP